MNYTAFRQVVVLFTLICLNFSSFGQAPIDFQEVSKHKYTDGIIVADLHKFGHVFQADDQSDRLFKRFNRARKTQVIFNSIYGGLIGAGIGLAIIESSSCNSLNNTNCGFGALAVGGATLGILTLTVITNAIIGPIKKSRKKKLLNHYNQNNNLGYIIQHEYSIDLSLSGNGLGVTMTF